MKDKRILICCNRTLSLGGIEKALVTFLREFQLEGNEVWLVLADDQGILTKDIPKKHLHIFYTNSINTREILFDDLKHLRLIRVAKGVYNRLCLRHENDWYARIMYGYRIIEHKLVFPGRFDCAISFSTDYSDLSMVLSANAKKRVAFVHGDATAHMSAAKMNDHLLQKMDRVYCVSDGARAQFLKVHPGCAGKTAIFHNLINAKEIRMKAEESVSDMICDGCLTLCTVGRLSPEKGQMMIPETAEILKRAGKDFRWYLVGEGVLRQELEEEVERRNLKDQVILLGAKINPYPYMKNCDIYVQTSLSEAYCITIAEARVLTKPIVSTPFVSVDEQIKNGENGIIAEAMTPDTLAEGIVALANHPELRKQFVINQKLIENTNELQALYDYISE